MTRREQSAISGSGEAVRPPKGFLEVGNDGREVIINHPDLKPDADGIGHITFSPEQARNLARLLIKHADELECGE